MADRDQDRDRQPARQPLRGHPALAGSKVELVFDPFDLTDITVQHHGRPAGKAVPFGRHVHPKAAADAPPPATPTGIDNLHRSRTGQTRALGQRLRYAQLTEPTGPVAAPPDHQPTADGDGLRYDTDLLGLAAHESAATASVEVTG